VNSLRMPLLLLTLCAVIGYWVMPAIQNGPRRALLGQPAPPFDLPDLIDSGHRRRLQDFEGQVVVLDFWASWCRPCAQQSQILARVARNFSNQGVQVLGINTADDPNRARAALRQHALPYPSALDDAELASVYLAAGLPTLVFIDTQGQVSAWSEGVMSEDEIAQAISAAQDSETP
jgi:cytochrome c biogenesis protein CcmG, thiol:disulfide interchange protein DsbE